MQKGPWRGETLGNMIEPRSLDLSLEIGIGIVSYDAALMSICISCKMCVSLGAGLMGKY